MPPSTLDFTRYLPLTAAPSVPFDRGQILLAQVGPMDGGTRRRDASAPLVGGVSDGGVRDSAPETATDAPTGILPATPPPPPPPPVRVSLADSRAAAGERARILSDEHLLGSDLAAYRRAEGSRYQVLSDAIAMIRYHVEGTHVDSFSSRRALLALLRAARETGDPVLQNSVGNIMTALGELTLPLNRAPAQAMVTQVQELQRLLSPPSTAVPVPAESPPPPASETGPSTGTPGGSTTGTGSSSGTTSGTTSGSTGSGGGSGPSVSTLRQRATSASTRATTACTPTPTSPACVTARRRLVGATTAYRRAVCAESPRAAACTDAREAERLSRSALATATSSSGSTSGSGRGTSTGAGTVPPPLPAEGTP